MLLRLALIIFICEHETLGLKATIFSLIPFRAAQSTFLFESQNLLLIIVYFGDNDERAVFPC